ncbi:MAG: dihydrofolate reductase [Bdellovibrionales bacterium]
MILSHIVAASENNVIGTQGDLPWSIPEDMQFFREKTKGHAMIMGRKTFESFPNQKPLPGRLNVVVTRQKDYSPEGVEVVDSIEKAIELCRSQTEKWGDEVFIIGGGEIYKQSLPLVDRIYLTRIYAQFDGDTTYPDLDSTEFKLQEESERTEPVRFAFQTYEKIK